MSDVALELDARITVAHARDGLTALTVFVGEVVVCTDEINLCRMEDRQRYVDAVLLAAPALADRGVELRKVLDDLAAKQATEAQVPIDQSESGEPKFYVIDRPEPLRLAEHYLDHVARDAEGRLLLRRYAGSFWKWGGSHYSQLSDEAATVPIWRHLDRILVPVIGPKGGLTGNNQRLVASSGRVREVTLALPSCGTLVDGDPPLWLARDGDRPDPKGLVLAENGLIRLSDGALLPATPDLFATSGLPVSYDSSAASPAQWLKFLHDLWGEDRESIALLQECFGYLISADTSLQKILLLIGPKRSGKGTIGRVLTGLLGARSVANPTLAGLAGEFGLQDLIGKSAGLIGDARLSGRVDQVAVVERLLSISGEDRITVNRKYKDPISVRLGVRFVVMTNEIPRLNDVSGALAGRFVVLQTTRSFFGQEDPDLSDRLLQELPGILKWALEGRRRLTEQRAFTQPASSMGLIEDLAASGSPLSSFVEECCSVGPDCRVLCPELLDAWRAWCAAEGISDLGTSGELGRGLRALGLNLTTKHVKVLDRRVRTYVGIELRVDRDA